MAATAMGCWTGGQYAERVHAIGDQQADLAEPFPVLVVPATLVS